MFNPYSIILVLFVVSGILVTLWGLRIILLSRRTLEWPTAEGTIVESTESSNSHDLLPHIMFFYTVEGQDFNQLLKFSGDITPTEEFTRSYIEKYPEGSHVLVYYDPANPEMATLEPGLGRGDWLVMAIGLSMLILGIVMFFLPS